MAYNTNLFLRTAYKALAHHPLQHSPLQQYQTDFKNKLIMFIILFPLLELYPLTLYPLSKQVIRKITLSTCLKLGYNSASAYFISIVLNAFNF